MLINQLAFLGGRKLQLLLDRYPKNADYFKGQETMKLLHGESEFDTNNPLRNHLDNYVKQTLHENHVYLKQGREIIRRPKARINGADQIEELPKSTILDGLSAEESDNLGQCWQYLLDTDQKKYNSDKLNLYTKELIIKVSLDLKDKIKSHYFKIKPKINYNDDLYECQCGRKATCHYCGRDFCYRDGTLCHYCEQANCGRCGHGRHKVHLTRCPLF